MLRGGCSYLYIKLLMGNSNRYFQNLHLQKRAWFVGFSYEQCIHRTLFMKIFVKEVLVIRIPPEIS